ncbi:MAG: hypothetical protein AAGF11_22410 [Myxococcota bacterium]
MYDFNLNEFHHRHIFYLDADGCIHPIPAYRFDRLRAGYRDAALPQLPGQNVHFAIFHVAHRTDPMRMVDEIFHVLPLDTEGNIDARQDHDALQADVDRLEANDYAPSKPSDAAESRTSWVPDPFTHRRLIAALLDAHHQPWNSLVAA